MVEVNTKEAGILRVLLKYRRMSLTTGRIADLAGISWNTADKYLREMEIRGWVKNKSGYWKALAYLDEEEFYEDDS